MTDREMLELAAKAAGIKLGNWAVLISDYYSPWDGGSAFELLDGGYWNPLTDDGDALRLAVKLKITDLAICVGKYLMVSTHREGDDIFAITRRAIVRAAAELGRSMP